MPRRQRRPPQLEALFAARVDVAPCPRPPCQPLRTATSVRGRCPPCACHTCRRAERERAAGGDGGGHALGTRVKRLLSLAFASLVAAGLPLVTASPAHAAVTIRV